MTKTVLITGPSGIACGLGNRLEIISNIDAIEAAYTLLGYKVERRPVIPGENLDSYEKVFCIQQTIASWAAPYTFGFLYTVGRRKDAYICYDDWQAPEAFKPDKLGSHLGLVKCAYNPKLVREHSDEANNPDNLGIIVDAIRELVFANERKYLLPVFVGGDYSLIRCNGIRVPYCPYPLLRQYQTTDKQGRVYRKNKRWVLASLQDNSKWVEQQCFRWPVLSYGVRKLGQMRVQEKNLAQIYAASWGVLYPPHKKLEGSGWYRVRAPMAIDAGSILYGSPRDMSVFFGDTIFTKSGIEASDEEGLGVLAERQRVMFKKCLWNEEQLLKFIQEEL